MKESRTYSNNVTSSDHRILVARMNIETHQIYKKTKANTSQKPFDNSKFKNQEIATAYKENIKNQNVSQDYR